jgi:hypothetical protein
VLVRISRREKARHFLPFLRARFVIRLILGTKRCHFYVFCVRVSLFLA